MYVSQTQKNILMTVVAASLALSAPIAHAEGGSPDTGKKVTAPAKPRYHGTIKVAKPTTTKTPDAPIPYVETAKAASPSDDIPPPPAPPQTAHQAAPQAAPQTAPVSPANLPAANLQAESVYDLPSKDVAPPLVSQGPLPAPMLPSSPTLVAENPLPPPEDKSTIILKCDTVVFSGSKARSSGSFYIGLFPLAGIEEQWSDFRIYRVDPQHDTLLRLTYCLDKICSAQVNETAYFLIAQSDKKTTLRITLDRYSGAYLGEYSTKSLAGLKQNERYEKGSCQKATLGQPKF